MKLNCLLVDDEPEALAVLESYVRLVENLELVGKCENAIQAFSLLQDKQIDVLFLDIKMPQLLGTDFVRSLRHPPKIIFTTAYREYAVDGFDLDVTDYLLKPISFDRFLKAVAKLTKSDSNGGIDPEKMAYQPNKDAFLYFRADRKMIKVFTNDILYVESLKDYVKITTTNSNSLVVKQAISSLEEILPESHFVRIHRSYLVAIDKIKTYTSSHIEIGGTELPIGRLFQKGVERALKIV
ncbi:LytR/AlgR family response regulator transcription factor [Runella aurantiaca]|uniref:DNA-binding response regulator n=1 Tax=Runella aurantiaca TaxID=2282308 RepID=A0A369IMQ8_9BACT|nr:LytTR family DNA-binding domain-containing protein [Runella aurantiaca]RDB07926.1 DNA-binding response regulator [Runella aurantiaca]